MNFSKEELVDMTFIIGEAQRNCLLASRLYKVKYPNRRCPQISAFERLKERFIADGHIKYNFSFRPKTVINEGNEERVLQAVVENPHVSIRNIRKNLDFSERSVSRILRKNKFHPYKVQLHQELLPMDHYNRMQFCQRMLDNVDQNPGFLNNILWTDEAIFHNNGYVNRHNYHYYADANPHLVNETHRQHRWSLNVWGGIIGTTVVGPHFFDGHLNGAIYRNFLVNELAGLLEDVPLDVRANMWYQHDGAPSHNNAAANQMLDEMYRERWIGRRGPVTWPARSPDLTPLDFFLWGHIKEIVYKEILTTRDDMRNRITLAFQEITRETLLRVRDSVHRRLRLCINNEGGHFEQFM